MRLVISILTPKFKFIFKSLLIPARLFAANAFLPVWKVVPQGQNLGVSSHSSTPLTFSDLQDLLLDS